MKILVLSPDPIVFGPPRPCTNINCYFHFDELPTNPHDNIDIEQFMLRHRFLGFRDILVVDDE